MQNDAKSDASDEQQAFGKKQGAFATDSLTDTPYKLLLNRKSKECTGSTWLRIS